MKTSKGTVGVPADIRTQVFSNTSPIRYAMNQTVRRVYVLLLFITAPVLVIACVEINYTQNFKVVLNTPVGLFLEPEGE
jgi:hypothetical protein